jgi:hypothetical protein
VCARRVNLLVCSLPLHRHSYIGFILAFTSSIHNKQLPNSYRTTKLQQQARSPLIINNNNRSPSVVSFMPTIDSTSGRLHGEFVRLLFLQTRGGSSGIGKLTSFFVASGVQPAQTHRVMFHFHHAAFTQQLKRRVGLTLAWRDVGRARFPLIAVMTRQFLAIPVASATAERVYSFAGANLCLKVR